MTYRGTQIMYLLNGREHIGQFKYHVPVIGDKIEVGGIKYRVTSRVWPDYSPRGDEDEKVFLGIVREENN